MLKKNINNTFTSVINPSIELVTLPALNVLAFQTTCHHPDKKTNVTKNLPYKSFNLGLHVADNKTAVEQNRYYIEKTLLGGKPIQWLEQVHGSNIAEVNHYNSTPLIADASITENKGIALAIMTADCLPILLATKKGAKVAAIHGGWRPLADNIIAKTIAHMTDDANDLVAWLGPCIGPDKFEVGEDVYSAFVTNNELFSSAFISTTEGKYLANLHKIAKIQLHQHGVTTISTLAECTYTNDDKYYSYRRNPTTGRMATIICYQ